MTNRIQFSLIPFPQIQFSGDIHQLAQLLADHLQGNLDQSVFTGQDGGTEPQTDIGLWRDNDTWKYWDNILARYVPFSVVAGLITNGALFTATLHANNTTRNIDLQLPDSSGTLARIEDVNAPIAPGTTAGNIITLAWDVPDIYSPITAAASINDPGGSTSGQSLNLWVETPVGHATPLLLTFPAKWIVDSATLGASDATHRIVDRFLIRRMSDKFFVSHEARYSIDQTGPGGDTVLPTVTTVEAIINHTAIRVIFNELMTGVSIPADWIVRKSGTVLPVSSVSVNGDLVRPLLNDNIQNGFDYTVQYVGATLKDVAGNAVARFGPTPVTLIQN